MLWLERKVKAVLGAGGVPSCFEFQIDFSLFSLLSSLFTVLSYLPKLDAVLRQSFQFFKNSQFSRFGWILNAFLFLIFH